MSTAPPHSGSRPERGLFSLAAGRLEFTLVDMPVGIRTDVVVHPVQVRSGDDFLRLCGQRLEQGISPGGVQLAKDVIQEQQRMGSALGMEERGLGEFQRQRDGALLAFAGIFRRRESIDGNGEIVPLRTSQGDTAP